MLHIKFHENRLAVSGEEDFECFLTFYHIWAWRPFWSRDLYFAIKLSLHPWMLHIKFQFDWLCGFREEGL